MTLQEKLQLLKEINLFGLQNKTFLTDDCEEIQDICTKTNQIWTRKFVTASCGCCSESIEDTEDLDWFIDHMSETDFNEFIEHIQTINSNNA